MKDGRLVQLATPEEMVTHPADDYVREFTKNAPRDQIVSVGAIAVKGKASGEPVLASTKIADVAARVLSSDVPVPVVNDAGRAIGVVTREAMITGLYPDMRA